MVDQPTPPDGVLSRIYQDLDLEVWWFPAIVERFGDSLDEIAKRIMDELEEIGSDVVFFHVFEVDDQPIMIATGFDEDREIVVADADLAVYDKADAQFEEADGESHDVFFPRPMSETGKTN